MTWVLAKHNVWIMRCQNEQLKNHKSGFRTWPGYFKFSMVFRSNILTKISKYWIKVVNLPLEILFIRKKPKFVNNFRHHKLNFRGNSDINWSIKIPGKFFRTSKSRCVCKKDHRTFSSQSKAPKSSSLWVICAFLCKWSFKGPVGAHRLTLVYDVIQPIHSLQSLPK